MTDHECREVLWCSQRVLRPSDHLNQLLRRRGNDGREGVGGQAGDALELIERPEDRRHLGKIEVVHAHVDVELCDPLQQCLLLLQLDEEGLQDPLTDPLAALQVEGAGDEVAEVVVPYLRVCLLCLQRWGQETLLVTL